MMTFRWVHAYRLLTAALAGLFLIGCANDPFHPLADSMVGKKDQSLTSTARATSASTADICKDISFVTGIDVDTAYARIMRTLRFRTVEERKKAAERSLGMIDEGFKHNASPGSFYDMADLVGFNDAQGARQAVWMEMKLGKDAPSKTHVSSDYCISGRDPKSKDPQFPPYIEKLLRDSLK